MLKLHTLSYTARVSDVWIFCRQVASSIDAHGAGLAAMRKTKKYTCRTLEVRQVYN